MLCVPIPFTFFISKFAKGCYPNHMKVKIYIWVLCLSLSYSWCQTIDTSNIGKQRKLGHYASIRNFRMYYECYGKGHPLLLIHGNGGSIKDLKHQIPFFAKHFQVIVADSRAQGKSLDATDSLSYEMMADDYASLLDQLRVDSCFVIGWSDGAINALLLAMRHPQKAKKLAVTGANLWPDSTALDPWFYHKLHKWIEELPKDNNPTTQNTRKLLELMRDQPHINAEDLKGVKCPTMVIGGDHDVIRPVHTLWIYEHLPKAYLWILPNSGHSTLIAYKEDFNKNILKFFKYPYRNIEGAQRFD